jgi:hypothetical protein
VLARLLLASALTVGGWAGGVLGADATGAVPFDWSSIVGGALGSSPAALVLAWRLNKSDGEKKALEERLEGQHERNVVMLEKMGPILFDATRTLADVRAGYEADRERPAGTDDQLRRLEMTMRDLARDMREGR